MTDKAMVSQVDIDATAQDDWDMQRLGKTQQLKVGVPPSDMGIGTKSGWSALEKFPFLLHPRLHHDVNGDLGIDFAVSGERDRAEDAESGIN